MESNSRIAKSRYGNQFHIVKQDLLVGTSMEELILERQPCNRSPRQEFNLQENSDFRIIIEKRNCSNDWKNIYQNEGHWPSCYRNNVLMIGTYNVYLCRELQVLSGHLVLVMTLWVRSTSALLDFLTSSLSISGRESIAAAARLACFMASSLARCIPRLFPRYSSA